ncbi:MAG: hypothetical protein MJZ13_10485 [Bacteroidales bacterium]|nr:hypothetical protein [Bacteroidales bacterium]
MKECGKRTVLEVVAEAKALKDKGVFGIDLLGYRYIKKYISYATDSVSMLRRAGRLILTTNSCG